MSVIASILAIFTAVLEWFATALTTVSSVFYDPETGFTFIGTCTAITFAIGAVTLILAWVRSITKARG